eukprot:7351446-Pyramimonas_sp.AAC.1
MGRACSEGSEVFRPSEKFSTPSPKTQLTPQKARRFLKSPAVFERALHPRLGPFGFAIGGLSPIHQ